MEKHNQFLPLPAVAGRLGVSVESVRALIRSGKLAAIDTNARGNKIKRYKVAPADLQTYLDGHRVQPKEIEAPVTRPGYRVIRFVRAFESRKMAART